MCWFLRIYFAQSNVYFFSFLFYIIKFNEILRGKGSHLGLSGGPISTGWFYVCLGQGNATTIYIQGVLMRPSAPNILTIFLNGILFKDNLITRRCCCILLLFFLLVIIIIIIMTIIIIKMCFYTAISLSFLPFFSIYLSLSTAFIIIIILFVNFIVSCWLLLLLL